MLTSNKPHSHFNAYYQDNAILIQLVVTEFLTAYELCYQGKLLPIIKNLESEEILEVIIKEIIQPIQHLLGTTSSDLVASKWSKGSLTKLKDYSEQFSRNYEHANEQALSVYTTVHHAWVNALHVLELLRPFHRSQQMLITTPLFLSIKQSLNQFQMSLNIIQETLPSLVRNFRKNENIIFFLLRHKERVAKIYGEDFMSKFFKEDIKAQPDLLKSLRQRCVHQGLEHLLPSIESNIN